MRAFLCDNTTNNHGDKGIIPIAKSTRIPNHCEGHIDYDH